MLFQAEHADFCQTANDPQYPSTRTLERAIHEWGYCKKEIFVGNQFLISQIALYFYQWRLTDSEILLFLIQDGYTLSNKT